MDLGAEKNKSKKEKESGEAEHEAGRTRQDVRPQRRRARTLFQGPVFLRSSLPRLPKYNLAFFGSCFIMRTHGGGDKLAYLNTERPQMNPSS